VVEFTRLKRSRTISSSTTWFARYLHKVYPKDLWNTQIVTLGSVPGINTRYRPMLHALYGKVAIREIYGATECMFGQQRDEKKASRTRPNYDLFFPWHTDTVRQHMCCPPEVLADVCQ